MAGDSKRYNAGIATEVDELSVNNAGCCKSEFEEMLNTCDIIDITTHAQTHRPASY